MHACARVVELVDTRDLKSLGLTAVPVQVRVRVPFQRYRTQGFTDHLPYSQANAFFRHADLDSHILSVRASDVSMTGKSVR